MKRYKHEKKSAIFIALTAFLLLATIGTTVALLITKSETISNEFTPTIVSCKVEESFDGTVKRDVCVRNTGNINAFIRATLTVNWVNDETQKIHPTAPVAQSDYEIIWGQNGWIKGADGFYYYQNAVSPNAITSDLIESITPKNTPDGYSLQVRIIASAIQSAPETVAEDNWGVIVAEQTLIP